MSYSPEPGRDPRPAPWASPSTTDTNDTQRFDDTPPAGSTRVDQPVADRPVPDRPVPDRPVADQPVADQGAVREGVADQGADVTAERQDPWAADRSQSDRAQSDRTQSDRAQSDRTQPVPAHGGPYPYPYPAGQPMQPQSGGPWGPPPAPPVPQQRTERRGPGWTGVVAVGAGAALLSSLLTIGIAESRLDASAASQTTSGSSTGDGSSSGGTSSQGSSAPLVTNGAPAPDWVAVARSVEPSVVSVRVTAGSGGDEGSGIVYDGKGHVLTNHHVIAAAAGGGRVQVVLSDGRAYSATIVGSDPSTDLAVLQVKNPPSELKPASFADSGAVKVGDPVMAVGNPLGLSDTVTTGIVSALNRPVRTQQETQNSDPFGGQSSGDAVVTNAIQTDAAVNPGNSGGALVDAKGRVIGVTSSIASLGATGGGQAGNIGLGFAIPSSEARDVADQLLRSGTVQHAFLGVTLRDGSVQVDGAQRQAAVIEEVTSGSQAAKGGLKSGDSVIAVDGNALEGADSLIARIRALHPGSTVTLTVVRDGAKTDLKITLGTKPASNG
jgi:putative serine protease PepD